jgi:formylglycine-generating enzyme
MAGAIITPIRGCSVAGLQSDGTIPSGKDLQDRRSLARKIEYPANFTGRCTVRMGAKSSVSISMFEKLLQGFKIGDLPYADFQYHLKRLLSTGAPPEDLMAVLRRREVIEPLPEFARDEVQGLLNAAIERAAEQNADAGSTAPLPTETPHAPDATSQGTLGLAVESEQYRVELRTVRDSLAAQDANVGRLRRLLADQDDHLAALEARVKIAAQLSAELQTERKRAAQLTADLADSRSALAAEQGKSLEMNKTLAQQAQAGEAARLRGEQVQRQSEQLQAELLASRESLEALQREHETSLPALESRAKIGAQLEGEMQSVLTRADALAADLAASQAALEAEKIKSREWEEGQRELDRYQSDLRSVRDALAARDETIAQMRHSLGERNTQLSALQKDHGQVVTSTEARAKSSDAELQAARARIEEQASQLKAAKDAAAVLKAQRDRDESQLRALRAKLGAAQTQSSSYLEILQSHEWRTGFDQNRFRDSDARSGAVEPVEPVDAQSSVSPPEAGVATASAPASASASAPASAPAKPPQPERAAKKPSISPLTHGMPRLRGGTVRAIGIGIAIAALAVAGWLFIHLGSTPATVPAVTAGTAPNPGTVIRDCPRCPAVTVLPTGRFIQGSDRPGSGSPFEKPLHWVAISRAIAMSTNAVTVDEFSAFVAATGRDMRGCDTYDGEWKHRPDNSWENPAFVQAGSHPVTCVSWNDAKAYAGWMSSTTGHRYRLPSASEWEYASRSGGEALQPWNPDGTGACESANVADQSAAGRYPGWTTYACNDGYVYTSPVGSFKPNAFGLHDMLGNVFQWTEDCWYPDYVGAPIDGSARTAADCSEHELRGGSWFTNPAFVRADYRNHFDANYRTSSVGIRLVRDLAP